MIHPLHIAVRHRRPSRIVIAGLLATVALLCGACSEDPVAGERCPQGADFDEELGRCVSDGDSDDAGLADDAGPPETGPEDSGTTDTGLLDTGAEDSGPADTDPGEPDTGTDDTGTTDTGTDDTGTTDTGTDDTGTTDTGTDDTGTTDTGSGEPDTDPGDPPECGDDLWDDTHDGEDPWEEPLIDCDDLDASWNCDVSEHEQEVLDLINEKRSEEQTCGTSTYSAVNPVQMNEGLQCASRIHSWDMVGRDYFDHHTPEGLGPGSRASLTGGGSPFSVGENINSGATTPEGIVSSWMNSAPHCANIMNGSYSSVGVGIYGGRATLKLSY